MQTAGQLLHDQVRLLREPLVGSSGGLLVVLGVGRRVPVKGSDPVASEAAEGR